MMRLLKWSSWPNCSFTSSVATMQKTNSAFLPMKLSKNKSHSSFCCTGCVKTNLALVETVSLMRLSLCYWATHRLLVIHVNHYCFIIENHSSSLYKSVGPSMHRPLWGRERRSAPFFSWEGCSLNTQWWPVGFFHLCHCPRFCTGRSLQRSRDRWLRYW